MFSITNYIQIEVVRMVRRTRMHPVAKEPTDLFAFENSTFKNPHTISEHIKCHTHLPQVCCKKVLMLHSFNLSSCPVNNILAHHISIL